MISLVRDEKIKNDSTCCLLMDYENEEDGDSELLLWLPAIGQK
jgi:hypothetical protein